MDKIEIEFLFVLFLIVAIGAYIKGKRDNLPLLLSLGKRSSVILGVLVILYNLFNVKEWF